MGVLSSIFNRGKKASVEHTPWYIPEYKPSTYDAPSADQLYKTYSSRAKGEGVGFAQEDLGQMRGEAIDESTRNMNELVSRGMAGRSMTGGMSTGGINRLREKAIMAGGYARSKAMRDVSIQNAVLKRRETSEGIQGLYSFLESERVQAQRLFSNELARAGLINTERTMVDEDTAITRAYNMARTMAAREPMYAAGDFAIQAGLSAIPGAGPFLAGAYGAAGGSGGGGLGGSGGGEDMKKILAQFTEQMRARRNTSNYR